MSDTGGVRDRLSRCFAAYFANLSPEEIPRASMGSVAEWDSMAYLSMIVFLEEQMGFTIPPDTLVEAKTPGDLFNTVKSLP